MLEGVRAFSMARFSVVHDYFLESLLEGNVKNRILISMMFLVCMDLSAAAALHAQENFYKDKTIRLIVGCTPGGFYDRWGRLFARYMPKYIPGNPEIIVQNMPEAGSLVAANYVYKVAKPRWAYHGNRTVQHLHGSTCGTQRSAV